MSIAKKTIMLIVCITLPVFIVIIFISNYVYIKGFGDLETQQVVRNVNRATDALTHKLQTMDSFCHDWASWDDTYYFAKEYNQEYLDRNLMDKTFITSNINVFLVLNTQGDIIYGKAYDFINEQDTALPPDVPDILSVNGLAQPANLLNAARGIIMFSGQPMIVVSRPILDSLEQGPSAGSLVMGRFLDVKVINELTETTQFSLSVLPISNATDNPDLSFIADAISENQEISIQPQNRDIISGYVVLDDIKGNPAFIIQVDIPRDIHSQGLKTIAYLHASLLFIAIVFCLLFVLSFRYLILNRLTALSRAVNAIGSKGDISNRVSIKGKDELSRLADNINDMLYSLEKSEVRQQSQKEIIGHVIANTPNGVLAINDAGYVAMVNESFRAMFDLSNRNLIGVKIDDIPSLAKIILEFKQLKESRSISLKKELHITSHGEKKIYIASFARLKEEDLFILYMTDISEERLKQESLYLTDRLASIGEMASGIAHELNNPLTSIIGLSEIVSREEIPESIKEDMGLIKSESHRAAGIVRNLLSFARKNATIKQPGHINKIIQDVLKLRSYEHGVNNIKVILEMDPSLPDILIDYAQIQQVFINIILNAEHAMVNARSKGTLRVKTEMADDVIRISFTDDGPGIEPQNLRRIFDPFFTTKEVGKGTGLGLSISYGIVTAHNGKIYATSEYGKGATFIVELPLHDTGTKETK